MNKSYLSGRDLYNFLNNNINEIEAHTENEPKNRGQHVSKNVDYTIQ